MAEAERNQKAKVAELIFSDNRKKSTALLPFDICLLPFALFPSSPFTVYS
jgi:hypothetical protein